MATSPPPPRRFQPDIIETTVRSSRSSQGQSDDPSSQPSSKGRLSSSNTSTSMPPSTKPRRFLPQPVEESTRSCRKKDRDEPAKGPMSSVKDGPAPDSKEVSHYSHSDDPTLPGIPTSRPPRRFAAEPVETSTRSSRRKFKPEPIETSSKKSKDKHKDPSSEEEATPKPRRKFAPEPIETTTRSSKDNKKEGEETEDSRPRRKFIPEPIETTTATNRRRQGSLDEICEEPLKTGDSSSSSRTSSGPRKFSPELLETAKGSYRRFHAQTPETSVSPAPSRRDYSPPRIEEDPTCEEVPETEGESRYSAAALARKTPESTRQHSFIVPDLPIIESTTEDEDSEAASLTDSSSSLGSFAKKGPAPPSAKDSYTEYVLRLAAETVSEQELQDQAMAAYINERPHQPVDHFAIDHDDDEDGPLPSPIFQGEKGADVRTFRRSSAAELALEMDNMRRHHEQLEAARRELRADTAGQSRFSAAALATRHALEAKGLKKKTKKPRAEDEDAELARMRAAASPPMLGGELVFPFTISPKMTRCDPDQAPRPRTAESDDEEAEPSTPELWHSQKKPENNTGEGLWMGVCQAGLWQPQSPRNGMRSGIQTPSPMTPAVERNNPFESTTPGRGTRTPGRRKAPFPASQAILPLTPPRSQDGEDIFTSTIDKKLQIEKQIEEEFPNRVITQIYNYLSLGYPSLAHAFDEELSKIARIPIEELRKDDNNVDAKGYVGAPEGDGWDEAEVIGRCKRWEALRIYVKEWARQSPNFADERKRVAMGANEDWGARARRGSWAH